MSLLEKILFVADFISEDRKYSSLGKIKYFANISLDEAVVAGIEFTVKSLFKKKKLIDLSSIEAYNFEVLLNQVI